MDINEKIKYFYEYVTSNNLIDEVEKAYQIIAI
jgi:hypothetical protein